MAEERISSPKATGGAGTVFEHHVGAYWLGQMVLGAIPPIWIDATVTRVHFQTERLGWRTDDFLVECDTVGTRTHKLVCHVKSKVSISESDERFKSVIEDFWTDYKSPQRFSTEDDRLVLVTQQGTTNLLTHFASLLDCARVANNESDFYRRVETKGFVSETVRRYWRVLLAIISGLESGVQADILTKEVWEFVRVIHVLSLDLATSTRQTEAQMKSMLGQCAAGGDRTDVAGATWDELLRISSESAPAAASFVRSDLPDSLFKRLNMFNTEDRRLLAMLTEHSEPVLRGVRTIFGDNFHLDREPVIQDLKSALDKFQFVIVSGPSGSGKSTIAKSVIDVLSLNHFAFAFRAEEFARSHIDEVLHAAQIPSQATSLIGMLGAQDRILVLVDAAERLLERSTRDAFSDLISLAIETPSIQVILTCRDYSTELVRSAFLQAKAISSTVLNVPSLTDLELDDVSTVYPTLKVPLSNIGLRDVLRNPYFLDKALELSWSDGKALPETEREFRDLFWRDVVRADADPPPSMPSKRETTFISVAVGRAKALSSSIDSSELDQEAVNALKRDSLLVSPDRQPNHVSTSHDVLEDWAILRWLDAKLVAAEGTLVGMESIGTHPAIRRSYRRWLGELLDRDSEAAERLFNDAFTDETVGAQFQDDTIASLLRANRAPAFLESRSHQLLANNAALLKRVIHVLRVACVGTPNGFSGGVVPPPLLAEPKGPSWPSVLSLIHQNIEVFNDIERVSLIGLLEDATRGLSWWSPTLDGAEFVAACAFRILEDLDDYHATDSKHRVLKVIAKVPAADATRFETALRGTVGEHGRLDSIAEDLRQMILFGMEGLHVARELPDLVRSIAKDSLLEIDQDAMPYEHRNHDLNPEFGLKSMLADRSIQSSAIHGPWLHLLRYHPTKGLAFVTDVLNHSANTYAEVRGAHALEPAKKVQLTFPEGKLKYHWANQRLWNLYRGTSVGPNVLISMLMALERYLLDIAEERPDELDQLLISILMSTDSASLAAVVAGVATAHPQIAGEALLTLLSAPAYIEYDRGRMIAEVHAKATASMVTSMLNTAESRIYSEERTKSNDLPHRSKQLEIAILELQFGPFARRVALALDVLKLALPPDSSQKESDRLWRLALHRMDLREMQLSEPEQDEAYEYKQSGRETSPNNKRQSLFRLLPKRLDADLEPIVEQHERKRAQTDELIEVLMWGMRVWERDFTKYDPIRWQEVLNRARSKRDFGTPTEYGTEHAPGAVAAVCIRDYWEEMDATEQAWCTERVCSEVLKTADNWERLERIQRHTMSADRHSAAAVVMLLRRTLTQEMTFLSRRAFIGAITHPVDEVRAYALNALDPDFWDDQPEIAMRSVQALATEAVEIRDAISKLNRRRKRKRSLDDVKKEVVDSVRSRFWEANAIRNDVLPELKPFDEFVGEAITYTLAILRSTPNNPSAVQAFVDASQFLVEIWDDRYQRTMGYDTSTFRTVTLRLIEQYCMRANVENVAQVLAPILDAIDQHPDEVLWLVQGLTQIEDVSPNTRHYWHVWQLFADRIKSATWLNQVDRPHHPAHGLIAAIFLTLYWKDEVRHWRSLEGYSDRVHSLFDSLRISDVILNRYLAFLYHIGEKSLPDAFVRIANQIRGRDVHALLQNTESVFLLEVLLQRNVYGRPAVLKADPRTREATLFLLDALVDGGSSAAFRMRDDFVTPTA